MKTRPLIIVTALSIVYLVALASYARTRPIDGDEGYYCSAARLVGEGKVPYRDFFYQQAPLLPYLFSWTWRIDPRSVVALRTFSALCGGLALWLWGVFLVSMKRVPLRLALATFVIVLLNPYWFSWHVVVKTYAVANLLISVALICMYQASNSGRLRWFFLHGLALGFCASARSLYAPLIPVTILWLLRHQRKTQASPWHVIAASAGCVAGFTPMLYSFLRNPQAFVFDNFRYHSLDAGYMWVDNKLVEGYQSIGHVVLLFVAHGLVGLFVFHPYLTVEMIVAATGVVTWKKLRTLSNSPYTHEDNQFLQFALIGFVAYTLSALVPFPPYEQYFDSPWTPFLIPFVVEGLRGVFWSKGRRLVLLSAATLFLFWFEVPRESAWNSNSPDWQMAAYRQVSNTVATNSDAGETVLSFWPGYVFESGRNYLPGLEDNFTFRILNQVSPAERIRYHLTSTDEIVNAIARRATKLVVLAPENVQKEFNQDLSETQKERFEIALQSNYSLLRQVNGIAIYRVKDSVIDGMSEHSTANGPSSGK